MIRKEQVVPMILEVCPSFQQAFSQSETKNLLYVVMGDLVRHLLEEYRTGRTGEFTTLCELIERLLVEGEPYVKDLAVIGLLEGIQNAWRDRGEDPENFGRYLLSESRQWWKELNDFWQGKNKLIGTGMHNKAPETTP